MHYAVSIINYTDRTMDPPESNAFSKICIITICIITISTVYTGCRPYYLKREHVLYGEKSETLMLQQNLRGNDQAVYPHLHQEAPLLL